MQILPKLRRFSGFGENSEVEIQDKFINSYNRNYIAGYEEPYILVIKSGALGDGAHLLCCIKPINFWDFRNMRAEVIFYLDLPQKSIMKLNIDL